jgi:hypothetical protein
MVRDNFVYGLDRGATVQFPAITRDFSLHHRDKTGSTALPAPYPVGTRISFSGKGVKLKVALI